MRLPCILTLMGLLVAIAARVEAELPKLAVGDEAQSATTSPMARNDLDTADAPDRKLAALAENLESAADAWARGEEPPNHAEAKTVAVTYKKDSLPSLRKQLMSTRKDPTNLYVINGLLEPLTHAKQEVILAALPMVEDLTERLARYKELPKYSPQQLAALQYSLPDDLLHAEILHRQNQVYEMRQNKAKREIPLKLHNEEAHLLQKQTIKLMLLADDEDEDMEVLKMLASQEERQSSLFRDILSEIASQASGMAPERAKSLHDNLLKLADVLSRRQQAMRSYTCLGKVIISADSNSRFETIDISPASEVVKVANALASVAKTAVVAVHGGN